MKQRFFYLGVWCVFLFACHAEKLPAYSRVECEHMLDSLSSQKAYAEMIAQAEQCLLGGGLDSAQYYHSLGTAYYATDRYEQAIEAYLMIGEHELGTCKTQCLAWEIMGFIQLMSLHDQAAARDAFERGVERSRSCGEIKWGNNARNELMILYREEGEWARAIHVADDIIASGDTMSFGVALHNKAMTYYALGAYLNTIRTLRLVARFEPMEEYEYFLMASAFDHLHQRDSACHYYHRAAELGNPESIEHAKQCASRP